MFQKSVLLGALGVKNANQDESIVALRWAEYQKYLEKLDYIKEVKEEKFQTEFLQLIFENCLGYTLDSTNPNDFNLEREKKNETDAKKADGVIYVDNKVIGIIELKAQDTKNLDKIEAQAFNYHNSHSNSKYIIISNFDELRFYIDKKTAYERFSLFNLSYEEFKKLHLLLSYESIKNNIPLTLKDKSASFEKDISSKLYKDFSLFRTHLYENLVKNNTLDKALLLRLTQKLCDRVIFILFAEDRGLLTANTIKEIRERHQSDGFGDRSMYDYYKLYFDAINKGNERLNIPKYNGGLFAKDETLDSLIIDDNILDMEAQALSNYDFMSDVSVNILGHIFEQSLTDLEEINASINDTAFDSKKSKRKKDGVFYTPEYITKYIVDNTLGKLCNDKREELKLTEITSPKNSKKPSKKEQIQKDNLEIYRNWLLNLKILDPACGSGAFLNQALDFLIHEHQALQKDLVVMGDITAYYEIEKSILENNLYGVDINEDAVEIAKLSLWLRTASKGRELTKLADKIKCGNSLIDDKSVVDNAFVWEEEFSEVFENGGFDVVIGNPPYVQSHSISDIEKEYIYKHYTTAKYQINTYSIFTEKFISLLKKDSYYSLIIPNYWLSTKSDSYLRKMVFIDNYAIKVVNTYGVFENVIVDTLILTGQSLKNNKNSTSLFSISDKLKTIDERLNAIDNKAWDFKEEKNFKQGSEESFITFSKQLNIDKEFRLKDFIRFYNGMKPYEKGKGRPPQTREMMKEKVYNSALKLNESYSPLLGAKHIQRHLLVPFDEYIKYGKNLAAPRKEEIFKGDRILVNRIVSKEKIDAIFVSERYINNTDVFNLLPTDDKSISLKVLYLIIVSKLCSTYFKKSNINLNRSVFPKINLNTLESFPIPQINIELQQLFIKKADLMLELNKNLQETKQNFTNELELEKIPKKLQNFEDLDFEEFVKEYKKAKKIKLADKLEERNFKNDWKALFENDSNIALGLKSQINTTDKEIDKMVYELYGLSEEEIKIVEGI